MVNRDAIAKAGSGLPSIADMPLPSETANWDGVQLAANEYDVRSFSLTGQISRSDSALAGMVMAPPGIDPQDLRNSVRVTNPGPTSPYSAAERFNQSMAPLTDGTISGIASGFAMNQSSDVRQLVQGLAGSVDGIALGLAFRTSSPGYISGGTGIDLLGNIGTASGVPTGYTRAYRAVSQAEFDDIVTTGRFNQGPNSLEGKWFADRYDDVIRHGDGLAGTGNYRIVVADLPNNAPSLYRVPNLDGRGPARFLDMGDLQSVTPRPYKPR